MAIKRKTGKIYIANESFVANVNGIDKQFHAGRTRVYEDDEILKRAPNYFDELEDFDADQ